MPNIKSAEKRVSVINRKKLENKMVRSQMNTAVKKFNAAISGSDVEQATILLPLAASKVDVAAKKGVIHKNAANRKKSQMATALYQLEKGIIVIKTDVKTQKQAEQKAAAVRKAEEAEAIRAERAEKRAAKEAAKAPAKDAKKGAKPAAKTAAPAAKPESKKKAPAAAPAEAVAEDEVQ